MATMNQSINKPRSSSYGEDVGRQANVLASCYLVDTAGTLQGVHYCTTSLTGAECPPLAAITADNRLALTPKKRSNGGSTRSGRRGGATLRIREECERFFCETMSAVFYGDRNSAKLGSRLTSVHSNNNNNGQLSTPPDDYPPFLDSTRIADVVRGGGLGDGAGVNAWLEVWDYAGGTSFRGFVADDGSDKTLFAFFDAGIIGRDLKQALMALIELAEAALLCSGLVICISRSICDEDAQELMKGLQWAGFSLTGLDFCSGGVDVTSKKWLFMGMEL